MFGFFNACVTGGRDRFDYRLTDSLLVYGTFGYFVSASEQPGAACDRLGRSTATDKDAATNYVGDVSAGAEWRFDDDKSIAFFNVNARVTSKATATTTTARSRGSYSVTKYITGPYSFEISGRHRYRIQDRENIRGDDVQGSTVVAGRAPERAEGRAQMDLLAGLRVHVVHRPADLLRERRSPLQVHEPVEPAPLRRPEPRRTSLRERHLPRVSRVQRRARRAHDPLLTRNAGATAPGPQ